MKNKIEYMLPPSRHKSTTIFFMFVMGLLSLTTVFLCSGFAGLFKLNEILSYLAIVLFALYMKKGKAILKPSICTATTLIVCLFVMLVVINYDGKHRQLVNLCSTFGIVFFVKITLKTAE